MSANLAPTGPTSFKASHFIFDGFYILARILLEFIFPFKSVDTVSDVMIEQKFRLIELTWNDQMILFCQIYRL